MKRNDPQEGLAAIMPIFLAAGASARGDDATRRDAAVRHFLRMDDHSRCALVEELLGRLAAFSFMDEAAVGGVFRQAWDSEPYLNGTRWGSYFTAVAASKPDGPFWNMGELIEDWGGEMMLPDERDRFASLSGYLTVYRGGVGSVDHVAGGLSWTTDPEIARFYAETWPRRWGDERPGVLLRMEVNADRVAAVFDDRAEAEALIPFALELREAMSAVDA